VLGSLRVRGDLNRHTFLRTNVLVFLPRLGFRAGRPYRFLQPLALAQPRGYRDPVHGAVGCVFFPCGARYVAAHDGLQGEDLVTADLHAAGLEVGCEIRWESGERGWE